MIDTFITVLVWLGMLFGLIMAASFYDSWLWRRSLMKTLKRHKK